MYYMLYTQLSIFSIILLRISHWVVAKEAIEDSREAFPEDFRVFLKGLSSHRRDEGDASSTKTPTWTMRSEVLLSSQKAALRDILMMKLVSYYEDKYRVSHHVMTGRPETIQPITLTTEAQIFTEGNKLDSDPPSLHSLRRSYDISENDTGDIAEVVVI